MRQFRRHALMLLLLLPASQALAGTDDYNDKCMKLYTVNCRQNMTMDASTVQACILRGWDPPITCRKNNGVSDGVDVAGSNGFSYGAIAGPEDSAGHVGAPPSVDVATVRRTATAKQWAAAGNPSNSWCKLPGGFDLCKLEINIGKTPASTPTPPSSSTSACPQKDDSTGLYGTKTSLTISTPSTLGLTCGGGVPLSSYRMTLNKSTNAVAATEYGAFYIWLYSQSGTNGPFNLVGNALKLPTVLCKPETDALGQKVLDAAGNQIYVKSVDLTAPVAQMITFNSKAMPSLVLRLMPRSQIDSTIFPAPIPPYDDSVPEKYLVLPIKGGSIDIPADPTNLADLASSLTPTTVPLYGCALESDYYKTAADANTTADLTIESATVGGCEGSADQCAKASPAPTSDQSCDIVSYSPDGASCTAQTQWAVLDRPELMLPAGAQTTLSPLTGRSAVLIASTDNSRIYLQSSVTVEMGSSAPSFTLNEGGRVTLSDGSILVMNGPATIMPASHTASLGGGGQHISAGGAVIETYAVSGGAVPTATLPATDNVLVVNPMRSITMPAGYQIPTMATQTSPAQVPYVQIPVVNK